MIANRFRLSVPRQTLLSYMINRPRLGQMNHQMATEAAIYSWEDAMRELGIDTVLQDFRIDSINSLDIAFGCGHHQGTRGCLGFTGLTGKFR